MVFLFRMALLVGLMSASSSALAEGYCRTLTHLGVEYTVCTVDPKQSTIRLHNFNRQGRNYGGFRPLADALWADRIFLRMAINGGMYHHDFSPVGLYVENGVEKQKLNLRAGWGNFHLLPNGVFFVEDGKAGVMEAKAYAASKIAPLYATQSGPMLVIDGNIHPRFDPQSDSLKKRNGVGIAADGRVVLVISEGAMRFYDFATLFRDVLGCRNALFLDGSISSLYVPEWRRNDTIHPLGPIISVEITIPPG